MPERDFVIVRFVFIFVRADSLQYLNLIMPERGIVIVCTIQCSGEPRSPFVLVAKPKQARIFHQIKKIYLNK